MINKYRFIGKLMLFTLASGFSLSADKAPVCKITISHPENGATVKDNGLLHDRSLFAFTVSGKVENLGENKICIYQRIPGGKRWWRSGEAIGQDDLGPNQTWETGFASCDSLKKPRANCAVKAVVQANCPDSGSTTESIGEHFCASAVFTYRTN